MGQIIMAKKVAIKSPKAKPESAEEWVVNREITKRLTIDVPLSVHARLKIASVKRSQTMGDIVQGCIIEFLDKIE